MDRESFNAPIARDARSRICDLWLDRGVALLALAAGCVLVGVVAFLLHEAWPVVASGHFGSLFTDLDWRPGSDRDPRYGILPMLTGSALVTLLAIGLAAPIGIAGAVFQHFYAPPLFAGWQDRTLELLAGVPSVVFGFWGLTVLVPLINVLHPPGQSLLAAGLVLALMILPTVTLTTRAALGALDTDLFRQTAALGMSRPTAILSVALPAAWPAIGGGLILAVARAVGETLAVVMVCGNISQIPESLFDPVRPITATIALEMGYATADHRALLYAAGLVLVVITGTLVAIPLLRRDRGTPASALPGRTDSR